MINCNKSAIILGCFLLATVPTGKALKAQDCKQQNDPTCNSRTARPRMPPDDIYGKIDDYFSLSLNESINNISGVTDSFSASLVIDNNSHTLDFPAAKKCIIEEKFSIQVDRTLPLEEALYDAIDRRAEILKDRCFTVTSSLEGIPESISKLLILDGDRQIEDSFQEAKRKTLRKIFSWTSTGYFSLETWSRNGNGLQPNLTGETRTFTTTLSRRILYREDPEESQKLRITPWSVGFALSHSGLDSDTAGDLDFNSLRARLTRSSEKERWHFTGSLGFDSIDSKSAFRYGSQIDFTPILLGLNTLRFSVLAQFRADSDNLGETYGLGAAYCWLCAGDSWNVELQAYYMNIADQEDGEFIDWSLMLTKKINSKFDWTVGYGTLEGIDNLRSESFRFGLRYR